jgi:hypothetical protein
MTRRLLTAFVLTAVLVVPTVFFVGCSSPIPRRDPTGEAFPAVRGESLAGEEVVFPAAGDGEPVLLLVGYVQDAQFDLDRWLLALAQAGVSVRRYEVPTIEGMAPRMFSGQIDAGMRRGIPEEDWQGVVTVYGDAPQITRLTGTENPNNGRILLLDGEGKVAWFWDRGFSVGALQSLQQKLAEMSRPR